MPSKATEPLDWEESSWFAIWFAVAGSLSAVLNMQHIARANRPKKTPMPDRITVAMFKPLMVRDCGYIKAPFIGSVFVALYLNSSE